MPNRVQTSPTTPRPLPTAGTPTSVTVQSGDTLGRIAQRLGVSADALVQANLGRYPSLATNRNAIQVGWTFSAPGAAPTTPSTPTTPSGWRPNGAGPTSGTGGVTGTTVRPNDLGNTLATAGAQSIELRTNKHLDAIEKTGIGTYFGDHSSWKSMDAASKQQ